MTGGWLKYVAVAGIVVMGTAPLADYHKHKGASMQTVTPGGMNCCSKSCGTIAPISLASAKSICSDVGTCWCFSYDADAKVADFKGAVGANSTDTYISPRGFGSADHGYRTFRYSTGGSMCDIHLTHTYQIPSSLCASQCDDEDSCNVFQMESVTLSNHLLYGCVFAMLQLLKLTCARLHRSGDSCKLYYWKTGPAGTNMYMGSGNMFALNTTISEPNAVHV